MSSIHGWCSGSRWCFRFFRSFYTKARLEFRTEQDDLISGDSRDTRNYQRYSNEFPDLDSVIIVVAAGTETGRAETFVDPLAKKLIADKANVKSVFYRIDSGNLSDSALLYLTPEELKDAREAN